MAGLVVALALIPEAIAFSIIAGVDPKVGLYASFCIATVIAFTGGRPGMISAATGAMALVMVMLVKDHGLQYLLVATLLTGVLQIIAGVLQLGKLMRFVSRSVITGFVNALAILIFLAQIPNHGNLRLGDTLTESEKLQFTGLPFFAPELFRIVEIKNPLKIKQLRQGLKELGEEGAIQVFRPDTGSNLLIGAIGQLQFEIVEHRLKHEYGVDVSTIRPERLFVTYLLPSEICDKPPSRYTQKSLISHLLVSRVNPAEGPKISLGNK